MSKRILYPFYFCFFVLVFIGIYWQIFTFHFWKDDWHMVWESLYHPELLFLFNIHIGTLLEFFVLPKFFGTNVFLWQTFGLLLKMCSSVSVYFLGSKFFQSRKAGYIAGFLFATSYAGIESVGWASAHVVAIDAICVCWFFYFLLSFLAKKDIRSIGLSFGFLVLGLLFDTARVAPMIFIALIYFLLFHRISFEARKKKRLFVVFGLCLIAAFLGMIWEIKALTNLQLVRFILQNIPHPELFIQKLYYIFYLPFSLFGMSFGWIIKINHVLLESSHGIYNSNIGFIAVLFYVSWILFSVLLTVKQNKLGKLSLFLLSWVVLFYLPNWLFEPRLIATPVHRYMVLSNIGWVLFLTSLLLRINRRVIVIALLGIWILGNLNSIQGYFSDIGLYRDEKKVNAIWNAINNDIGKIYPTYVVIRGEEPIKSNIFATGVDMKPLFLLRKEAIHQNIPVLADSIDVKAVLCKQYSFIVNGDNVIKIVQTVSGWHIDNTGAIQNISQQVQKEIQVYLLISGCS